MTYGLPSDVLAFFPTRSTEDPAEFREFGFWRARISDLCYWLIALPTSKRRGHFNLAQDIIAKNDLSRIDTMGPYWLFSQPSFEVFEMFIRDDPVCRAFADHLELMARARGKGNRLSRRRLKKLIDRPKDRNEAGQLASRYAELLKRYDGELFRHFRVTKYESEKRITLMPAPYTTEESVHAACRSLEERLAEERWGVLTARLKDEHYALSSLPYQELFSPGMANPELPRVGGWRAFVDELVPSMEVSEFRLEERYDWQPMAKLAASIGSALNRGTWPTFRVAHETAVVPVKSVEVFTATYGEAFLEEIRSSHLAAYKAYREESEMLSSKLRRVQHGLLPIGLKVHCLGTDAKGYGFLERSGFSAHNAKTCFTLPPVGNIDALKEMLALIERRAGVSFLENRDFQIQVCIAGVLSPQGAARLGIGFYLGSHRIRRYEVTDFVTSHQGDTGGRLVIYGAGVLDPKFEWWSKGDHADPLIVQGLPLNHDKKRTDVLSCESMRDIENVNLIGTLLVHAEYGGYWKELGEQFIADMDDLLRRHRLLHILDAVWVKRSSKEDPAVGVQFFKALSALMDYAFADAEHVRRAVAENDQRAASSGILQEMQTLLAFYRLMIEEGSAGEGEAS